MSRAQCFGAAFAFVMLALVSTIAFLITWAWGFLMVYGLCLFLAYVFGRLGSNA